MPTTAPNTADLLERGVVEVIDRKHLEFAMRRKALRVKLGIDPTGYHLHLGHAVPLRKLRAFQDAGHQAVLVIGDFTAQIGDPSGRDKSRTALSPEQTRKFSETYLDQVSRILDMRRVEVRYNSEWFGKMATPDFLRLLGRFTVNQLLAHESFGQRIKNGNPLAVHELTYPILQGYDSVAIEADVEIGGADQRFNLLAGRDVQKSFGLEQQDVILFAYLLGTDGKQKMSKTAANFIALQDPAEEMFGKVMSIPDKLIPDYLRLATNTPLNDIVDIQKQLKKRSAKPRDIKADLARRVVTEYYSAADAERAEIEFSHVFRDKTAPTSMPEIEIRGREHDILNLLVSQQLAASRSEARRLVEQGGVKIDQQVVTEWEKPVAVRSGTVLQVGKRRFVRFVVI